MRSSTSSSKRPEHHLPEPPVSVVAPPLVAPEGPWGRTWLAALLAVLVVLGGLEVFWRSRGHIPSVVDDQDLWAVQRGRIPAGDPHAVALLGTSRMLTNVSLETMRALLPGWTVVQLAVDGKAPMAALIDLAEDPKFLGVIVCESPEHGFDSANRDDQQEFVMYARDRSTWDNAVNRAIATALQSRIVVISPQVGLRKVAETLATSRRLPVPQFVITGGDRSQRTDYSKTNIQSMRAFRIRRMQHSYEINPTLAPPEWLQQALQIEPAIHELQARGGKLAMVRFPTTGEYWQADEQHYPRAAYWDAWAARTAAVAIHFRDVPALDAFDLPDTSHVDVKDTAAFTRALVQTLRARGVLPEGSAQ